MKNAEMTIGLEKITPQLAKKILTESNYDNRKIDNRVVSLYASEMKNGRWRTTSQGLSFDWNGKLMNGQHRLKAQVDANITIIHVVARNEDPEHFKMIDNGRARSIGTAFDLAGIANGNRIAAIIKAEYLLRNNGIYRHQADAQAGATASYMIALYNVKPEFYQNIHTKAAHWYKQFKSVLKITTIASYYIILSEKHEEKANTFFNRLTSGFDFADGADPIYTLRERLISNKLSVAKFDEKVENAFIIKTWNAFFTGKAFKILKFSNGEEFPILTL